MNKYTIAISDADNGKGLLKFIMESKKEIDEVRKFYTTHGPAMFDLMNMLIFDEDTWVQKKTSRTLNMLTSILLEEQGKKDCSTVFKVSPYEEDKCDEKEDKIEKELEELIEKLWGKAIKVWSLKEMKGIVELLEKLTK